MSIKRLLLALTASFAVLSHLSSAKAVIPRQELDVLNVQELLEGVDPDLLHDVLHKAENSRYRHGVFEEDRTAFAAILRENPSEATSIVQLAKREVNQTSSNPGASAGGVLGGTPASSSVSSKGPSSSSSSSAVASSSSSGGGSSSSSSSVSPSLPQDSFTSPR